MTRTHPNRSETADRVLVVGAGISGLLAARRLVEAGESVVVLDKARGVGGRMSTRRIGSARLDHGAQFFTAGDEEFRKLVREWKAGDVAQTWSEGFAGRGGVARTGGRTAYRGATGMNAIPKRLAESLDVRVHCPVREIVEEETGYRLVSENGETFRGRSVLLTAPVPQSLTLLGAGGVALPTKVDQTLRDIEYDPCFAVLAVLDGPGAVPEPGGLMLEEGPVSWIADNRRKGISPERTGITIHATADYSRSRLEADRDEVASELIAAAGEWLGEPPKEVQVHRWLYSLPRNRPVEPCVAVEGDGNRLLAFAGDAFGGASVQGAALSGLAAGDLLARSSAQRGARP